MWLGCVASEASPLAQLSNTNSADSRETPQGEDEDMSTLATVELVMRETKTPMSVRDIVELAGDALPTRSKTPDTVVARDLSMDIKRQGEESRFIRTAPGRYTLREYVDQGLVKMGDSGMRPLAQRHQKSYNSETSTSVVSSSEPTPVLSSALRDGRQGVLGSQAPSQEEQARLSDVLEAAIARQ